MFNFLLFSFFLSGWLGADRRWRWGGAWGPPPQISVGRNTSFLTQRQAFFTFSVFVFLFYLLWSLWGATPPSWHNAKHFLLFLFFFLFRSQWDATLPSLHNQEHFLLFFPPSISVGRNTSFLTQRWAFFTFSVFCFSFFPPSISLGRNTSLLTRPGAFFYFFCFCFVFFFLFQSQWGATPPSWHSPENVLLFAFSLVKSRLT